MNGEWTKERPKVPGKYESRDTYYFEEIFDGDLFVRTKVLTDKHTREWKLVKEMR